MLADRADLSRPVISERYRPFDTHLAIDLNVVGGLREEDPRRLGHGVRVSDSVRVTIVYEPGDEGWVVASIPQVPGAHSQCRTREARANVIDALRGLLELDLGELPVIAQGADSEPLELVIGA